MGKLTSLTKASPKTNSLRTTVPDNIVNQFNLTDRDKLEWTLVALEKGEFGIIVQPRKA